MNEIITKLIEVIEVDFCRGKGNEIDPYRRVKQYFSKDGELLAERDSWSNFKESK